MNFEFATAGRIIFGPGKRSALTAVTAESGRRPALVTGADARRSRPVFRLLKEGGADPAVFSIKGEPTTDGMTRMARQARGKECDHVVACGGGSVIDAGKALAALLTNQGDLMDYLEVIGKGIPLSEPPAPCIAIPTTAGTGSEVTRNAVLLSPEHKVKVSMRDRRMLPDTALVDPELTASMPPEITAATGLDAFTQLLEAFVSIKANPLTDGICREGLKRAARALPRAYVEGSDLEARTDMAAAGLFGGLALANAGLGAVHGFAGPIGGMFSAPHGMVCASLLAAVFEMNIHALGERAADHPAREKYREAAQIITGDPDASPADGLEWITQCCARLQVPGLEAFGITETDFPDIVGKALNASSMKGNPVPLSDTELTGILHNSLST